MYVGKARIGLVFLPGSVPDPEDGSPTSRGDAARDDHKHTKNITWILLTTEEAKPTE
jgi:hypothetical protein